MDMRLEPQAWICHKFDEESIALFPFSDRSEIGVRVVDNCAEEYIMQHLSI